MTDLFIFAGESSADLLGAELIKALPPLQITGVGGPKMRALGFSCVAEMEEFRVMGFVDVFFALPKLMRSFFALRKKILELNPKVVLFIDYAEFNLRMAESLRKKGFNGKLCHFVCPSVWAWGKGRIPRMARTLDLLLTLLPFEPRYFAGTPLKAIYVGHPLAKRLREHKYNTQSFPPKLIGLFPGSRKKEIERNLPYYLRAAKRLAEQDDYTFGISVSHSSYAPLIEEMVEDSGLKSVLLVPAEKTHDLMKASTFALAKSGTVTLELGLHKVPTVVTYAITPLDLFILRSILRIDLPHYCLVNIIQDEEVFPELIGPNLTDEALYQQATRLLCDAPAKERCLEKCQALATTLGASDPMQKVAACLQEFL